MISKKNYHEHRTKLRILAVAEALFAEKGYYGASLSQIARKVGIAKASLLHHFASKKALHDAILERSFGELGQLLGASFESQGDDLEKLSALIASYSRWMDSNPHRCRLMMREQLDNPRRAREVAQKYIVPLAARAEEFVREGQRHGIFAPISARLLILQLAGSLTHFSLVLPSISYLLDEGGRRSPDEIRAEFKSHVFEIARRALMAQTPSHEGGSDD